MVRRIKNEFDLDIETIEGQSQLAHKLYALNVSGVSARYGSADNMIGEGFKYTAEYNIRSIVAYKNLQTLLYQCSEGEVIKSKLYKFMDNDVRAHLANEVITNLPEYEEIILG